MTDTEITIRKPHQEDDNNNLSVYDAYRFRAIMEEAVERLDLRGLVTFDANRQRRDNSDKQGGNRKDVYHLMMKQKDLEEKFETLMQRRSQLRGLQNKSKYLQNQAELKEVSAQLRDSTSTIVQNLRDHPTVVSNIQKIHKDRSELQELLERTVGDLKEDQFSSLVDQVNYRTEQQRLLWETQLAHEKTREALKNLEQELRAERDSFQRSLEGKNETIHALTAELKHLKKVTALSLKYERETALSQAETTKRINKRALNDIKAGIKKAEEGIGTDKEVHAVTTEFLVQQQDDLAKLHEEWEEKLEADMGALDKEVTELQDNRDADLEVLVDFQRRWELDKAELSAKAEEKKQRKIEEENKAKLVKIMNLGQSKIHFFWRIYNRKRPKGKKKGKKSKKGSKKKK